MEFFDYMVLTKDYLWHYGRDRDGDELVVTNLCTNKNGIIPDEIPEDNDLSDFFDYSDEKDKIAKYMSENHSEIRKMVNGTHDKYNLYGVSVHSSGTIFFRFTDGEYFLGDGVPLNMKNFPGLTIETNDTTRKKIVIQSSDNGYYNGDKILTTEIILYQFEDKYRTIKTGMFGGYSVAFVTEDN